MNDRITPVNKAILIVNAAVFGLQYLFGYVLEVHLALWPFGSADAGLPPFRPWQLLTYGFLHGNFMHILFNMFAVYMFGGPLEQLFGRSKFIVFWFASVLVCGLFHG